MEPPNTYYTQIFFDYNQLLNTIIIKKVQSTLKLRLKKNNRNHSSIKTKEIIKVQAGVLAIRLEQQ